jgi:hypothetical protein
MKKILMVIKSNIQGIHTIQNNKRYKTNITANSDENTNENITQKTFNFPLIATTNGKLKTIAIELIHNPSIILLSILNEFTYMIPMVHRYDMQKP